MIDASRSARRLLPGVAACGAAAFLIGHLIIAAPWAAAAKSPPTSGNRGGDRAVTSLASDLDDIDAVNFAMGVEDYDVAMHRPHPPGYPLYVLLGKIGMSAPGLRAARDCSNCDQALALALWGAIAGALAAFPLDRLFTILAGGDVRIAGAALIVTLTCPLYWFTAGRPLSDMPGFAAALAVQALLATAFARQGGWHHRSVSPEELASTGRLIVLSALLAGAIAGLRSQTVWLTVPMLLLVVTDRAGRGAAGALLGSGITFVIGLLLWIVPLAIVSGGPERYIRALTSQAGEDLEGVDMLATSARPLRRLAINLVESFAYPWFPLPLAVVVLTLAVGGVVVLLRQDRRALALLGIFAGPYAVFHLLFQDNATTRYALPLVPAVAFLAVTGLHPIFRRWTPVAAAVLAAVSLSFAVPALAGYAATQSPIFRLFGDFRTAAAASGATGEHPTKEAPVVAMHRRAYTESRRAREWLGPEGFPWRLLPAPRDREWLELAKFWLDGGTAPIWFVADAVRTDLDLIDPASRHFNGHYGWSFGRSRTLVGGARPNELEWWVIDSPPGWFLGEGWALSPETAGIAQRDGKGPGRAQVQGWIRPRPEPARLVIGGRNLGAPSDPEVRFTLRLDGRVADTWTVRPNPGFFLRGLDLAPGALTHGADAAPGRFLEVTIAAETVGGGGGQAAASVEQFNLQPVTATLFGFDTGWHEDEFQPGTGLRWRWASDAAFLRIWHGGNDVRVQFRIESPLRTFDEAPIVLLKAGDRELFRGQPGETFTIDVNVPATVLDAADGRLTLMTDRVFVPAEHVGPADPRRHDRRRLGLRVFDVRVEPDSRAR